jgi:hypothetical protein
MYKKNLTITNLFRVVISVLLLWILFSINNINKSIVDLGANVDAVYNELSSELSYIAEDFEYLKVNNALDADLIREAIIDLFKSTKQTNEGTQ